MLPTLGAGTGQPSAAQPLECSKAASSQQLVLQKQMNPPRPRSPGRASVVCACRTAAPRVWPMDGGNSHTRGPGAEDKGRARPCPASLFAGRALCVPCLPSSPFSPGEWFVSPVPPHLLRFRKCTAPLAAAVPGGPCGVRCPWTGPRPTLGAALLLGPGRLNSVCAAARVGRAQIGPPGGGAWPRQAAWFGTLPRCPLLGHLEITDAHSPGPGAARELRVWGLGCILKV